MMFTEFMHFYSYTADEALGEYAKRFFALCNSMFRLQGNKNLTDLYISASGNSGGSEADKLASQFKKQAKGNQGILQEVRIIKK
jgi:hypothetical protein